jgi:hypothetical protein
MAASRKLYEDLASEIRLLGLIATEPQWLTIKATVRTLTPCLKRDNPRFNADKFYRACGMPELADN